jgi:hypothetical protein
MRKLLAIVVGATALALPAAAISAKPDPCTSRACHAHIKVAGVTKWASPQRLSGTLDQLSVKAGAKELQYEQVGGCTAYFYGRGVVARMSVCGRGKVRIRIRAVRVDPRPVTLRVAYRVSK